MVRLNWQDSREVRIRPKAWSARLKQALNRISKRVTGRVPFSLGPYQLFGDPPSWQESLQRSWHVFSKETNFSVALVLLAFCAALTAAWKVYLPDWQPDLWPEMGGMTLDVLFILVIFALFEHRRARVQFIDRQRETIDDYKRWDHSEAQVRLAGAIRRLNKVQMFALDLSALRLTDFSFAKHGIGRITGSCFYKGTWGQPLQETGVKMTRVSFDHVDCSNVQFSPFDPFEGLNFDMARYATLTDCTFVDACLRDARFNGAALEWSDAPPRSHDEVLGYDEVGRPQIAQTSYGPFDRTDLTGASFRACRFKNADFRNADGLLEADFYRASGLDTAKFDDDETKAAILANALRSDN